MSIELETHAEQEAQKAEKFAAFSGINLLHIKRGISQLLSQIGGNGIFDQYTRHDISHINAMLEMLNWIVPNSTQERMTAADWLLAVLSIYFHDLGLLVTKNEFNQRDHSGFRDFCERELFAGDQGIDYKSKIDQLAAEERERFLYQEYVRTKHAERVRHWIMGESRKSLGIAPEVAETVDELLRTLDPVFRRDLALVCESHHLDDLANFGKYRPRQPYGPSPQELGNVHFAAILLRTADLLHITRDRTPSILFRVLNPSDPISQCEWAKQMAVRSVCPMLGCDKDGNLSDSAPKDTIEVHAYFKSPEGFFGLTSYLKYAEQQLRKSHEWAETANHTQGVTTLFPWKHINSDRIETAGFLSETFEFTLDQARILDLLTGHTLYNDTSVVLRELVQNSLDAIRLQCLIENKSSDAHGRIHIHWNTQDRSLTIQDNGTGMSQQIIEQHLLKVGSSRYQDPEFKKQHPDFSPISRFGIGVLSTFMVADSVEIITSHPDDSEARQLTLRSVHGRYLINLLKKEQEPARTLGPHGTCVRLQIRPSATFDKPQEIASKWIVFPHSQVTFQVDEEEPISIGYNSPKHALESALAGKVEFHTSGTPKNGDVRIAQYEDAKAGVVLGVALEWSGYFKEWSFFTADRRRINGPVGEDHWSDWLGICIEGIRVRSGSPGFDGVRIVAISNASGPQAPKTNVARSGVEDTPESANLVRTIYQLYLKHVEHEIEELKNVRGFSLSWAVREARFLMSPFFTSDEDFQDPSENQVGLTHRKIFLQAVRGLPVLLIEEGEKRTQTTVDYINGLEQFWTVQSLFFRSAELLLEEVPSSSSLSTLITALGAVVHRLPVGPVLCTGDFHDEIDRLAFIGKQPVSILCNLSQRRLDICWKTQTSLPIWLRIPYALLNDRRRSRRFPRHVTEQLAYAFCASQPITIDGFHEETAIETGRHLWLLPGTKLNAFMLKIIKLTSDNSISLPQKNSLLDCVECLSYCLASERGQTQRFAKELYDECTDLDQLVPRVEFDDLVATAKLLKFDPWAWGRNKLE